MRLRRGCSGAWVALAAAALDRITKVLAMRAPDGHVLIPGVLNARFVQNTGMAFSLFSGQPAVLTALTLALIAILTFWLLKRPEEPRLMRAGLWLIVGGGAGNLYDRLVYGYVIDFLDPVFVRFAVFNVADACICVGAGLAILSLIYDEVRRRKADGA